MKDRKIIFWDFDGVIKDSVGVKSDAFERLFEPFGSEVSSRVRQHHEQHGGMSRFEKLPIYLGWAREPTTPDIVDRYSRRFSDLVLKAVIESEWVPGVLDYLLENCDRQYFVLVTATPQSEIEYILLKLDIRRCFRAVYGAPTAKTAAIAGVLSGLECERDHAVVVGDSEAELVAAKENGLSFVLRRTKQNEALQRSYKGPQIDDFTNG